MFVKPWLLTASSLLIFSGCTIKATEDEPTGSGKAGGSGGGSGGAAGENSGGAAAGANAGPCGDITEDGQCEKAQVAYCDGGEVSRLDCASVGANCVVSAGRAQCEVPSRTASCGQLTALGTCDGALLKYCDSKSVVVATAAQIDCAAYGQTCDPDAASDGGAQCVPVGACPATLTESGSCAGNVLHFCDAGSEYVFDCGADECKVVGGFADCFMPSTLTGCGTETEAGRCDGSTLVRCQSELVSREDCATLGLTCVSGSPSACLPTTCPSTCASGLTCSGGRCVPAVTPNRKWTVLVYMVADNNLSDAAWADINEMEDAGSNADVQVVVQWELSNQYTSLAPATYRGKVYRTPIVKDADPAMVAGLQTATSLGSLNLSDPANLADFVRWGAETYPAEHTAVILWDHGFGWRGGFVDGTSKSSMRLRDITTGLRDSGVHPDLVAFDACLMGMHEVGMSLRGVADTLVASEEVEPGGGFPYGEWLSRLVAAPTMTPTELGRTLGEAYTAYFDSGLRARAVTLSTIDLTRMSESNSHLTAVSRGLLADLSSNRRGIAAAVGSSSLRRFREPESADLRSMLAAFSALDGELGTAASAYTNWLGSSGLVAHNLATRSVSDATGQAIYLPRVAFSAYSANSLQDYRDSTSYLPLQPWHQVVASLTGTQTKVTPPAATGATRFSAELSWGDSPTSNTSLVDLDLYVYEPGGDYGTPANGAVTANGILSADSGESGQPRESYELRPSHAPGTYLILVNLYQAADGQVTYPKLVVKRDDAADVTYVRGKIDDRTLELVPMGNSKQLTEPVGNSNIDAVLGLEYSSIWYVTAVSVR